MLIRSLWARSERSKIAIAAEVFLGLREDVVAGEGGEPALFSLDQSGADVIHTAFDFADAAQGIVDGLGLGFEFTAVHAVLQPRVVGFGKGDGLAGHSGRSFLVQYCTTRKDRQRFTQQFGPNSERNHYDASIGNLLLPSLINSGSCVRPSYAHLSGLLEGE